MKKHIKLTIFTFLCMLLSTTRLAYGIENPLSVPNNTMGIHILFPDELGEASKLVNSSGGDWGYVTIPIQVGEKDLEKWQKFMDECKRLKLIPLVRLATEPDPKNTAVWRIPNDYDLIDFANFLNSLSWPTKNRYVILFNEVNRSDEWGGSPPSPTDYAEIVKYAHDVFKSRSSDFYLILGGMDAAAPNDFVKHMNGYTYLERLIDDPEVLNSVDAFSSHSYPNPDFSAPPSKTKKNNIASYRFEYELLNNNREKKLPVFITETGWSDKNLPQSVISAYYEQAITNIWEEDKDKIVAITPFLLNSSGGPFDNFSMLKNGEPKDYYKKLVSLKKIKGAPVVNRKIEVASAATESQFLTVQEFKEENVPVDKKISPYVTLYFKTILGML